MALVQINKNPSRRDLNWFGALFGAFFGVVGWLARDESGAGSASLVAWGIGVSVPAIYYAIPAVRRPLYLAWVYATYPLGLVVSYVTLVIIYFGIFTTTGLAMRLVGHDPLRRKFERSRESYWVERRRGVDPTRYFNQY